ncbi:MAG TPA: cupin domain-containing protein [Candidatus Limnocylindrales bacterium]|nr:cupin domain-containing protein [Candidatus Limnocylindrales bacterium]
MDAFTLSDALDRQRAAAGPWVELLSVPDLSVGLYVLAAGADDPQQPHTEDEVYVVLAGRSRFTAGDRTRDCGPGDVIFVPALVPHRFHDIAEEMRVVVVFGPAEGSRAG